MVRLEHLRLPPDPHRQTSIPPWGFRRRRRFVSVPAGEAYSGCNRQDLRGLVSAPKLDQRSRVRAWDSEFRKFLLLECLQPRPISLETFPLAVPAGDWL